MAQPKSIIDNSTALDRQNVEFDALTHLAAEWGNLKSVAVVDDDYPRARHHYESALKTFIAALETNGRLPVMTGRFPTDQPYGKATNNANVGDPSERDVQAMLQAGRPAPNFRELKDGRVPNSKGPLSATEMNKLTSETPRLRCPECGEWNLATHFIAEAGAAPWP